MEKNKNALSRGFSFSTALLLVLSAVIVCSGWLGARDLSMGEGLAEYHEVDTAAAPLISAALIAVFLSCISYFVWRVIVKSGKVSFARIGVPFFFFASTVVFPFLFSAEYYFKLGYVLSFVTIVAVGASPRISFDDFSRWARVALGGLIWSSILGAFLSPERAVAADYSGLISLVPYRLYGMGTGATGLGVVAVAYFILQLYGGGRYRYLGIVVALLVLFFCQSKTN